VNPLQTLCKTYLLLFAVDAVLTVLVGLGLTPLAGLQFSFALLVLLGGFGIWVALASTPRLPLSVFVPPLLFTLWGNVGAMPLPLWVPLEWMNLATGLVQSVLCVLLLVRIRSLEGGRSWMPKHTFEGPAFSWSRTLGVVGATVVGGPLALATYTGLSADAALGHFSADFAGLGTDGLWVAEREYIRDNQHLHLIGMVHIGRESAYPALFASIPVEGTLVLAEGVSDRTGVLAKGLPYDKVAGELNLSVQKDISTVSTLTVRNADVDLSTFSPSTLALLRQTADAWSNGVAGLLSIQPLPDPDGLDQMQQLNVVYDDILTKRNAHLLGEIDRGWATHNRLVVPWGAYHLLEVEEAVLAQGFVLQREQRTTMIPYTTVLGWD
jgi:hypothetical protein